MVDDVNPPVSRVTKMKLDPDREFPPSSPGQVERGLGNFNQVVGPITGMQEKPDLRFKQVTSSPHMDNLIKFML